MKSLKRRKHKRWLNEFCKNANQALIEDPLWLGRFKVLQKQTWMEWFSDKSGGLMHVVLEFRDKKTNLTTLWTTDCLSMEWQYWRRMNYFITEECKVWDEVPNPYHNIIDFRKVR